jgi:hypothetical protein
MLGLLSLGVRQAPTKRLNNGARLRIEDPANRVSRYCLLAFLLLFFVGTSKASATPEGKTLGKEIKLDLCRGSNYGALVFDLTEQPFTDWQCGVVELTALVSTESKPVTKKQTNKEPESSEKLGIFFDEIMNILKDGDVQRIFLWFVFGVICGYGPFEARRKRKPNKLIQGGGQA